MYSATVAWSLRAISGSKAASVAGSIVHGGCMNENSRFLNCSGVAFATSSAISSATSRRCAGVMPSIPGKTGRPSSAITPAIRFECCWANAVTSAPPRLCPISTGVSMWRLTINCRSEAIACPSRSSRRVGVPSRRVPRRKSQPVFCKPCETPLTQATSARSNASSVPPLARQRRSKSICSRLIGST